MHLVESLRDPTDPSYRGSWFASIRDVEFTTRELREGDLNVKGLTWTGVLVLRGVFDEVGITFSGEYGHSRGLDERSTRSGRASRVLEELRQGVPFSQSSVPRASLARSEVAALLGIGLDHCVLTDCDDARVLRTAVAVLAAPLLSDSDLATQLFEDPAFVRRIRKVHCDASTRGPWMQTSLRRSLSAFYRVGAKTSGMVTVLDVRALMPTISIGQIYNLAMELRHSSPRWSTARKKGYVFAPCPCGSTDARMMTIPEPEGPVCMDCRSDDAGLKWPSDPYDKYLIA